MTIIIAIYLAVFIPVLVRCLYRYKAHNDSAALRPAIFWTLGLLAIGAGVQLLENLCIFTMFVAGFFSAVILSRSWVDGCRSDLSKHLGRGLIYVVLVGPIYTGFELLVLPVYLALPGASLGIVKYAHEPGAYLALFLVLLQFFLLTTAASLISYFGDKFWGQHVAAGVEHELAKEGDAEGLHNVLQESRRLANSSDYQGRTPAHWAAQSGDARTLMVLIDNGAKVSMRDNRGQTPLHYAGSAAVVELLLNEGANPKAYDRHFAKALHMAANRSAVDALLKGGADLKSVDSNGMTAVHYAARDGRASALQCLVDHGADPGARSGFGREPLHLAAEKGRSACVWILLQAGADPNARDGALLTPLHRAVRYGRQDVVQQLLLAGADPDQKARNGKSACDFGRHRNDKTIVDLLEKGIRGARLLTRAGQGDE